MAGAASSSWTRAPMARHSWEIGELQPHPRLLTPDPLPPHGWPRVHLSVLPRLHRALIFHRPLCS